MKDHSVYQPIVERKEGVIAKNGVLCVTSGRYTARYAKGKYIVDEGDGSITYNDYHQPISKAIFMNYWRLASQQIAKSPIKRYQVGQHQTFNIHVDVQTELAWHQLFAEHLFLPPKDSPMEQWQLICVPSLSPSSDHPVFIGICRSLHQVLILGTGYAGEIKKSMFSIMNLILPEKDVLSLHCSAIKHQSKTLLMLGLSGTGKTTLSNHPNFTLIGDDEIGWCDEGVFNLEGGCYAKTAHITQMSEPTIYNAIKPPAILENVPLNQNGLPDYLNTTRTENQRAAFPLSHVVQESFCSPTHPQDIIFLCCDLYGVIPMVSKLTFEQALTYYCLGYTAKIGQTEVGANGIQAVSSPCFGHPFFAKNLALYRKLFARKLKQHRPNIWLVNTGWQAGGYYHSRRISLHDSRQIIQAIATGTIESAPQRKHSMLDLNYYILNTQCHFPPYWEKSSAFHSGCQQILSLINTRETID